MIVKAHLKNARMTPRKVRQVRQVLVDLPVAEARAQLTWQKSKAADLILGVLNSAIANAKHNHEMEEDNLKVSNVQVDEGIVFKRWQPASRGVAHPFVKRTSHVTVILGEIEEKQKKAAKKKTEIDTVTVEEFTKRNQEAAELEAKEEVKKSETAGEAGPSGPEGEAYGKKKMQQRGSGSRRDYRRKSM